MHFIRNILYIGIVISILFAQCRPLFAAELFFDSTWKEPIAKGQSFEIELFVNTQGEAINAIEGTLIFPQEFLKVEQIQTGSSIINLWIERPFMETDKTIIFSGITPGGYNGVDGNILTLRFQAKGEGTGEIILKRVRALRNDGQGSETVVTIQPAAVAVSKEVYEGIPEIPEVVDITKPQDFTPQYAQDPLIYDGEWFIVFITQDKESGIDHFEAQETKRNIPVPDKWIIAESPYVLQDQTLTSFVFVKAVDKAGNETIASLLPQHPFAWYEKISFWSIIAGVFIIVLFLLLIFLWKRITKKKR